MTTPHSQRDGNAMLWCGDHQRPKDQCTDYKCFGLEKERWRVLVMSQIKWFKMTVKQSQYFCIENDIAQEAIQNNTKYHDNLQRNYFKRIS